MAKKKKTVKEIREEKELLPVRDPKTGKLKEEFKGITQPESAEAGQAYVKEREKLASKAGVSSREAGRALIPVEQQRQEDVLEEQRQAQIEPQLLSLQEQEMTESEALRQKLITGGEALDRIDRLTRAGYLTSGAALDLALKAIGFDVLGDIPAKAKRAQTETGIMTKLLFNPSATIVGTIATTDIYGFSLASLFGFRDEMNALTSDASQNRETTEATLRGVREGGNVQQGISLIETLQQAAEFKYANAMELMERDPDSVADGLSLADDMVRDINRLVVDKFILERYAITGDPSELNRRVIELKNE